MYRRRTGTRPQRSTPNPIHNTRPRVTLLNDDQKEQVHGYALSILSRTGIRVDSPSVLRFLEKKLGTKAEADVLKLPEEVVLDAIRTAPKVINIFDRLGNHVFKLGDDRLRFGIGVTALFYQDPLTDKVTPFTCRNMQDMVRLGSRLPHYDVISTVGIVQDVPPELTDLRASLEMIANTTKALILLVSDEYKFPAILDMFEVLHGDLAEKPFVLPYFNPVSPLVVNEGTADKLKVAVERGLPVIYSNYSMAGASTPMTPAGTLALLLAELLAGLTISQLIRPGAPISLGMLPVYFDMKTMMNYYDPQSILINLACAEMMAYYDLPHTGTSGSGTGWGMDLIAADTYWLNTLTFSLNKGGLAPFIGDTLGSKAISPLTIVHVHEIIDQALRFAAGFQLDDAHAVLDEIHEIGPGGHFLTTPSTLARYKDGYYTSPLYPHWSMETWQLEGQPAADRVMRERTIELMENLPVPPDHQELISAGKNFIKKLKS
ncbi:MAG: trimethylamine methyltransferase family protein [Chloroflexota bacterium]